MLVYPDDNISDDLLQKYKDEIGSEYFYVDCKMDGTDNAGVFFRQYDLPNTAQPDSAENAGPGPGTGL